MLEAVASDHSIATDPRDNRKRRTVILTRRDDERFGFAVQVPSKVPTFLFSCSAYLQTVYFQSYLIKRSANAPLEQVSYVDNVTLHSPAGRAGLRSGTILYFVFHFFTRVHFCANMSNSIKVKNSKF